MEVTTQNPTDGSRLVASALTAATNVFIGAFIGTYVFGSRHVLVSIGIATVCALVYLVMLGLFLAVMAHRVKRKQQQSDVPITKQESYIIGEREYYPVRVTAPVMRQILEAQRGFEPDQQMPPLMFGVTSPSLDQRVAMVEALYKQIAILLVDHNGEHPQVEHLEVYLEVDQATDLLTELLYG